MWDVTWTDPDKKLVGEHRARKDKEGSENKTLSRHSVSTTSSKGSSHSAFSRLRAKATRQSSSSKESTARDTSGPLKLSTPEVPSKNSCRIEMSGGLDNQSDGHAMTSAPLLAAEHGASDDKILGLNSSNNEYSISSLKTTALTNSDDVFSSPGAKGTERRDNSETRYNYQRPYGRFVDGLKRPPDLQSPIRQSFNHFNGRPQQSPTRPYAAGNIMTNGDKLVNNPIPPARSPLRPATQKSYETKSMNNASCWRKPVDWSAKNLTCPPYQPTETTSGHDTTSSEELAKEVELMARAPPTVALTKLKEPYKVGMSLDEQRRLDIEKERWMISALQHHDRNWQQLTRETAMKAPETESTEPPKQKLLAFYEPQFSARYLAAFWRNKAVHHLSDRPLSFKASPNLHAIFKPSICTPFSELTASFDTVYSMLLPALCPEPEILTILRSINTCLKSRGSLNLIIIDPIPNINALGEKMRTWFVKNLLRNLQQKSRCLNPSGTLPNLLSQASLRGPGSIVTTTQFYANPQNIGRHDQEFELGNDLAAKSARDDREVRAELRSIAGRMLWKEVWGQFVTPNTWWWEDADCMKECLELGTFWEYHSIQAVKSN